MNTKENTQIKPKTWIGNLAAALGKLTLKTGILVAIGAIISYIIYYFKGFEIGAVMRVVGIVFACIGLASQLGEGNIRGDYNYNMAKMRDSKMLENEYNGRMTSASLRFLIWMGTSGIVLFIIGSAIIG